jgi:hypothetical protein
VWSMQESSRTWPLTETRCVRHTFRCSADAWMPAVARPKPSAKHLDFLFLNVGRTRGRLGMRDVQSGSNE